MKEIADKIDEIKRVMGADGLARMLPLGGIVDGGTTSG